MTRIDISRAVCGMSEYQKKVTYAVESYGRTSANRMAQYARQNRPWTDRTRHARRGLMPIAEWAGSKFKSGIRHSVSYGIYLENRIFSRKGRLSILKPTLDKLAPEIYRGLGKILDR